MGWITWAIVVLCALAHLMTPHEATAQGDGRLVWRTISTAHFEIHFHEPLGIVARHVAAEAEKIHERLTVALDLPLRQRVQLVLSDNDDAANGLAGPLPYNAIRLRVVAPEDMSPLADYDDWPRLLLTHEHTHILHLEHATGLPRVMQYIFGRNYTPQQYLPGWIVEGLATFEESRQTSGGRARDSIFAMYMRMDALEDRILPLDILGFDGEPWPHGTVRYLYGQALVSFIADKYGERALGQFVREYGRRLFPYGVSRSFKRATGKGIVELYQDFSDDLRARARAERDAVLARGRIEGERLTFHGELTRTPRFVSNDALVYALADARHVPELRTLSLDTADTTRITRTTSVAESALVHGTRDIVFSAPDFHRTTYFYNDLFRAELDSGRTRRLTRGLRAREPDVSRDGKHIAYVVHGAGTSHLEIAELSDIAGTRRVLVQSRRLEQVFTPRFSHDARRIAYGGFSRGGYRDIWIVDVATGERLRITHDRALDRGPVWSPDDRTLYFASDRTGISNLYAYDVETGALRQLTNVLGGAFQPDVSPDGRSLVYVGYTSLGFDLYRLDLQAHPPLTPLASYARPEALPLPQPAVVSSRPYHPLNTLLPRAWDLSQDDDGVESRLVANTAGADAVGFHNWSLTTTVGLETGNTSANVGYAYRKPRFPVLLGGSIRRSERGDLIANDRFQRWQARFYSGSIGTSLSFPRGLHRFVVRPDYSLSYLQKRDAFGVRLDPNGAPPRLPPLGFDARLGTTFSYSTSQRQAWDISDSWGHTLTLRTSLRDRMLGSRDNDVGLSFRAEQYVRFDFRESVLAFAYTGAWDTPSSLGGFPAQLVPLFDYIANTPPAPADIARLRGFALRTGDQLQVVQVEYRLLVARLNQGLDTLPLFGRRVHLALFSDVGDAYTGRFDVSRLGVGLGAELRFDWSVAYGTGYTLRAGLAHGITAGGELQWYTAIARPF
jgi:hypothetical protein